MKPAIVLAAHTMGLGVIRALGTNGVPVIAVHYDGRDMAHVSKYVVERIQSPHPENSREQFLELLIERAADLKGGLLIPTSDETLVTVSQHKKLLESHYTVACAEWSLVEQCIDKKLTSSLADSIGVPAPKTVLAKSVEDAKKYAEEFNYPCLAKPSVSHLFYERFGRKMIVVEDPAQMIQVVEEASEAGLEIMLQEIIPGDDTQGVNYNSYFWDGQPVVEFTARQIRNAPPWFGSPRVVVSEEIPEVVESGRKILQALGYHGYSCMEFKRDTRDGVYKLMEVNCRHNLSSRLAVHLGVNFPWLEYRHLLHGELPKSNGYQTGVYWIDIARDVTFSLRYGRKEQLSLAQFFRPYFKPHVFAIFSWKDLRPFLRRCMYVLKEALEVVRPSQEPDFGEPNLRTQKLS
jgi:D-aspartate ligase